MGKNLSMGGSNQMAEGTLWLSNHIHWSTWFSDKPMWRFPKMGLPPVIIHFRLGFSLVNHPLLGTPHFRNPPDGYQYSVIICYNQNPIKHSHSFPCFIVNNQIAYHFSVSPKTSFFSGRNSTRFTRRFFAVSISPWGYPIANGFCERDNPNTS